MMARIAPLVARFKAELLADKKRAIVLGVLLLVLIGAVGRMFIGRSTPASAAAHTPVAVAVSTIAAPSVTPAVAPGATVPSIRPTAEADPFETPAVVSPTPLPPTNPNLSPVPEAKPLKPVEIEPGPKNVTRDLFASSSWSTFPSAKRSSSTQPSTDDEDEPGFWGRLAAGLSHRGVEERGEIQRIERLAQELRLEATMSGDSPCARISGRLVRVGDTIKTFSVVTIDERSVTLALDGHHVSIRIP